MFSAFNNVMMKSEQLGCRYSFDQKVVVAMQIGKWGLVKVGKRAAVELGNDKTNHGLLYLTWFLARHMLFMSSSLKIHI